MKILFVNKYMYRKGGSETYMFSLAEQLKKMGHDVYFFGMKNEKDIVDNKYGITERYLETFSMKNVIKVFELFYSKEVKKKLDIMINDIKPDIVHLNIFNYQLTTSVIDTVKKYNIPIVHTVHDSQICCPYHRLYNFEVKSICEKCKQGKFYNCIKSRCFNNSLIRSGIGAVESYFNLITKKYKKIDLFISPSNFMINKIKEMYTIDLNMKLLYNFANSINISTPKKNRDYVLFFGRVSKEKGIDIFVKSAQLNPYISFKVCGVGPMLEEIKNYCKNSDILNVEFLGFKTGEKLYEVISNAKITVYPSVWYENCPLSIIESKSLGVPVIGSRIGGIPELIKEDVDGLLFESGDYRELSKKIQMLFNDNTKLEEFSINGINDSGRRFNIENYCKKIEKEYLKLGSNGGLINEQ